MKEIGEKSYIRSSIPKRGTDPVSSEQGLSAEICYAELINEKIVVF